MLRFTQAQSGCYFKRLSQRRVGVLVPSGAGVQQVSFTAPAQDVKVAQLIDWINSNGGFVDPRLVVSTSTPRLGCRGVVTTAAIEAEELAEGAPLIAVPESLYMSSADSDRLLSSVNAESRQQAWEPTNSAWALLALQTGGLGAHHAAGGHRPLSGTVKLALLLAHERSCKGPSSKWWPYIASLPEQPPSAWLMSEHTLQAALAQLRTHMPAGSTEGWEGEVQKARQAMMQQSEMAVQRYGRALEVDESGVMWATAQVLSRAFGSANEQGLAPLIDMCNHVEDADRPWGSMDADGQPAACITSCRGGRPHALAAGEELLISYSMSGCSPLESFLSFGFVAPELLRPSAGRT